MKEYSQMSAAERSDLHNGFMQDYKNFQSKNLALDMSRGKPSAKQVDLSRPMLNTVDQTTSLKAENGGDCANYGIPDGIPEARRLMAELIGVQPDEVFVGGNSSLNLMHDCMSFAYIHGTPFSKKPWGKEEEVKILCPSPGYDRHFAVSEHFGFTLVCVGMTPQGPDMDEVERLVQDPTVKAMWNVPKYQNPMGITYSDETVRRLANLKPAAEDFLLFWDNAYAVHDLDVDHPDELLNLMSELKKNGKENMALQFSSTSKVTFPGGGISGVASGPEILSWIKKHMGMQTIGYDKINQLRHAKYLPSAQSVKEHMRKHAEILNPKFQMVLDHLSGLNGLGVASWSVPRGGYFISLDVPAGCAKRIVQLCKEAGVIFTPAGATYPYGKDPEDKNIRIAPTMPPVEELSLAAELLVLCTKIAALEKMA